MDHAVITQGFTGALVIAMVLVIFSDAVRYTIPNWLNGAILALFIAAACLLPVEPLWALLAASLVLLAGIASFALGMMGGGDAKLLFVLTLWTGWSMATASFLFMTAMTGGLLVVVVLTLRLVLPPVLRHKNPERQMPRLLTRKEPVPYGLAIAGAFLWVLWNHQVPMLAPAL